MKYRITLETRTERPSGAWLLHLAIMLHQLRINPQALGWEHALSGNGANAWFILIEESARVRTLVEALQSTDGVRRVVARIETPPEESDPPAATD